MYSLRRISMVTVIIPAYNGASYMHKAIDSALMQDVPMEILVINDCSPDDTDSAMERYKDNPLVSYIKNDENMGVAKTRNRGVSLAKGEYVAFLDCDDYWAENKLKKQLEAMERDGTVLCSSARELLTPEGEPTGRIIPVKEKLTYKDLLRQNPINCSSVLLRTEVAREFPMHHEDSHEDYIMWLEILRKYGKASAVNEPLLKYRLSTTGKSGNKFKSARMTFSVYRYMGFGLFKSLFCFVNYMFNGVFKYAKSFLLKR